MKKEGDDFESSDFPQGDPLDLKAYHPSDGLKKIAWKIYARNQTLISRHPERAMSPEGTISIISLATLDDSAARLALNYIKKASESEMLINFNCLGITDDKLANNYTKAYDMLVESVWNSDLNDENLYKCLNSQIKFAKDKQLKKIVLIISDIDCINPHDREVIVKFIDYINSINITPILFIAQSEKINLSDASKILKFKIEQI